MISRSTLVGALVVVELVIVGFAVKAIAGGGAAAPPGPFAFPHGASAFGHPEAGYAGMLNRSFAAGPQPRVVIDARDVDVIVVGDGGPAVNVVETLHKSGWVSGEVPPITAQQTPEGVRIAAAGSSNVHFVFGSFSRTLRVTVPNGAHVELTSAGSVDASGLRAKVVAHLAEGSVRVSDHRGDVDVSTGTGAIRLTDVQGDDIAASTRDGRVYLTRIGADRIDANSASGRIVGADVRAVDGALTTRDGRITITFASNSDTIVTAHTADDRVRVTGLNVVESGESRSVVRLGSGRGRFELSTESGPVTINQGASV